MDGRAKSTAGNSALALPFIFLATLANASPSSVAPPGAGSSAPGKTLPGVEVSRISNPHAQPYLGLRVALEGAGGARVLEVLPNGPAAFAGVLPADRVIGVEARAVDTPADLSAAISQLSPGQKIRLMIRRGGTLLERSAILAVMPRAVAPDRTAAEFLSSDGHDLRTEITLLGRRLLGRFQH